MTKNMLQKELENFNIIIEPIIKSLLQPLTIESKTIINIMQYSTLNSGKRFRPFLLWYLGNMFNINNKVLLHIGGCIELLHSYTLIHDDLPSMDNDDYRRGKLSSHKMFSEAMAILAGDALQSQCFMHLSSPQLELNNNAKIEIIYTTALYSGTYNLISGQVLDINFVIDAQDNLENVLNIHLLKTAKLFSLCGAIVSILANAEATIKHNLILYCEYFGLIWQIVDDLNDYTTDKEKNTVNLVNILGYQKTQEILNNYVAKINLVIQNLCNNLSIGSKDMEFNNLLNYILAHHKK